MHNFLGRIIYTCRKLKSHLFKKKTPAFLCPQMWYEYITVWHSEKSQRLKRWLWIRVEWGQTCAVGENELCRGRLNKWHLKGDDSKYMHMRHSVCVHKTKNIFQWATSRQLNHTFTPQVKDLLTSVWSVS